MNINFILKKNIVNKLERSFWIMLLLSCSLFAKAQNQTVTLPAQMTLKEAFIEIEKQTNFSVDYNNQTVNANVKLKNAYHDAKLSDVLPAILKEVNCTYAVQGNHILVTPNKPKQESRLITGTVTDTNGESVIGASVVKKGTTNGTVTDVNGGFTLTVENGAALQISYIGYVTQEVAVGNQTNLQITLIEDALALEEVVVVGYGTQKKVNLTGSIQNVSGNELTKRNTSNTSTALQGLIPGVSVVQSSGQPGADAASIVIRGTGSLNSSTGPLVLIDGVEGDMNHVDMNTIESISVLKDAASASIYGSRASNGVILITTKRSKEEKVRISYNGYAGFNTPTELPEPVSAIEYMEAVNIARANADQTPQYLQEWINDYKTLGPDNFLRYEAKWKDKLLKKTALVQNHSLSLSGGNKNINYFVNAGYLFQDGQISNNNYSRMTLRLNTDARITHWLKVGVDINLRQSDEKRPSQATPVAIIDRAITFNPVFSAINDDGTWGFGENGNNPIAEVEAGGIRSDRTPELGIKGFVQLNPVEGLDVLTSYSSRNIEHNISSFIRQYDTYEGGAYKTTMPSGGQQKSEIWNRTNMQQFNLQASYEKNITNHYLKILGGMQTEELIYHSFETSRKGYDYSGFEEIKHGDIATASNNSDHHEWAMLSYFGRVNYAFANRYLLELNARWDASSRFVKDEHWGFFPSVSAGWRISEESFFEPAKRLMDNLKLRGSYGTLGNQDIGNYYPYAALLYTGYGYWFNKELGSGVAQTQMDNPKISWEKSTQTNVGLDVGMFQSRLNLTFDYYVRNIDNMLQQLPIPMYVGLTSAWENAGTMRNKGWDLSISYRDKTGDLTWSVTGNLSDVKNEILNLYGKEYISGTTITREGLPYNSWYGYLSDGYFQDADEIEKSPVYGDNKNNVKPGYIRYKDISGPEGKPDGVINDNDRTMIGNPFPRYQYGLSLGAEWKGFDVSLFLQGVGKKDILLSGSGARPFYVGRTIFKYQLDSWTPENRYAEYPLLLIDGNNTNPNNIVSDFWIKSGAYMRLKNFVIGYTLPANILGKIKIDYLRLYISGQNLFTVSNAYKGYDPEESVSGGSFYPVMKTFTFGIDFRF